MNHLEGIDIYVLKDFRQFFSIMACQSLSFDQVDTRVGAIFKFVWVREILEKPGSNYLVEVGRVYMFI